MPHLLKSLTLAVSLLLVVSCSSRRVRPDQNIQQPSSPLSEVSYADIVLREQALGQILQDSIPQGLSPINACIYGDMLLELALDYELDLYKKRKWKRYIPEVERWRKAAFSYLITSAESDFPPAQQSLGDCYSRGWAVDMNIEKAVYWYEKAAKNGLETARYRLARMFGVGTMILDVVTSERNEWFVSAVDNGWQTESDRRPKSKLKIQEIIVHCSATSPQTNYGTNRLWLDHRYNGWSGIGYHYYITRDGVVYTTRDEMLVGAHTRGHNAGTIGICYEGGIDSSGRAQDTRTPAQKRSMDLLIQRLRHRYSHVPVKGHRNYTNDKDCPSFDAEREYN